MCSWRIHLNQQVQITTLVRRRNKSKTTTLMMLCLKWQLQIRNQELLKVKVNLQQHPTLEHNLSMIKVNKRMLGSEKRSLCERSSRREPSTNWRLELPSKIDKLEALSKILLLLITTTMIVTWSQLKSLTIVIWEEAQPQSTLLKFNYHLPRWRRLSSWPKARWEYSEKISSMLVIETD